MVGDSTQAGGGLRADPGDVLVRATGVMSKRTAKTLRPSEREWRRVMAVNLDGACTTISTFVPGMVDRAPPRTGRRHCRAVKTRRQDSMTGTFWRDMPACRDQNVPVVAVHQRAGGPDRSAWITAETALVGADARAFSDPCVVSRSVFVDTGDVSPVDFDLSVTANEALIAGGLPAAHDFLSHWNEPAYLRHCRGVAA